MTLKTQLATAAALALLGVAAHAQAPTTPEAPAAPAAAQATDAPADNQVRTAFKRVDANADGRLSRDEAVSLPAVAEKFTQIDKDGDGAITMEEFEAGVAVGRPAQQ